MKEGFFRLDNTSSIAQIPLLPRCAACGLYKQCRSPKMPVSGKGLRKILVCGESPGRSEDLQNRPFVGASGDMLETTLRRCGIDLRRDCWITNALRCKPPDNKIEDSKSIEHCRPFLLQALRDLKPEIIILLGSAAVTSLIGWLWREDPGGVLRWRGRKIPSQKLNAWIVPTLHPSYIMRQKDFQVAKLLFEQDLRTASDLSGRPFDCVPDHRSEIDICIDDQRAARILRKMIEGGGPVSFDFETEGLKPEGGLQIYCASFCWRGKKTIAFPWRGEAVAACKELLQSRCRMICHHAKFEERWCLANDLRIREISWDSLQVAHLLDNRKFVCELKFLTFSELGQEPYEHEIKPYLKPPKGQHKNQIHKADLSKVLLYCGLDSLLTFKLAQKQAEIMNMKL